MKIIQSIAGLAFILFFVSCGEPPADEYAPNAVNDDKTSTVENVLTQEERDALSPEDVLEQLKEGNRRFVENDLTPRNFSAQVTNSTDGQYPKAVVLSCLDSRVPVEHIFDRGIGDIFVGRVAGNFINDDLLGSMEFGCKVAGAKLILVLGHEHCGAIKSAIDDVELGNITGMLKNIKPAVEKVAYDGDRSSNNEDFVHMVCKSNVKHTMEQIRSRSSILNEMEQEGQIKIIGGIYNMSTGEVEFME
ncbi:MAG: carbonic anhydrase [Saprospirales bacterium]|nr:MAG: carbonic anhydrase [Saprospirales bacterium]